jgi:hypothetical protein
MARKPIKRASGLSRRVVGALRRGFALGLDAHAMDRLLEASRAEASLCAALYALHADGESGAREVLDRMEHHRGQAKGREAIFVWDAALHALGLSKALPYLRVEGLAHFSDHWRSYRRRLRRLGSALAKGSDLAVFERDLLSEASALLNRMRAEGSHGVGWPNAWLTACRQRDELDTELLEPKSAKSCQIKDSPAKSDIAHASPTRHRL